MIVVQMNYENGYLEKAIPFIKEVPDGNDRVFSIKVLDYEGLVKIKGLSSYLPSEIKNGEAIRKDDIVSDILLVTVDGVTVSIKKELIVEREVRVDEIFVEPHASATSFDIRALTGIRLNGGNLGDR